jgi:hypothetical protein
MLKNVSATGTIVSTVKLPYVSKTWETMIFDKNGNEAFCRQYNSQLEASKWHAFYSIEYNARRVTK